MARLKIKSTELVEDKPVVVYGKNEKVSFAYEIRKPDNTVLLKANKKYDVIEESQYIYMFMAENGEKIRIPKGRDGMIIYK